MGIAGRESYNPSRRRVGVSRRTIYMWSESGEVNRDLWSGEAQRTGISR